MAFTAGYQHSFLVNGGAKIVARVQTRYTGAQYLDYQLLAVSRQGAYTKTDLSLSYNPKGDRWSLDLFARNLEGTRVLQSAHVITADVAAVNYSPPRLLGIRIGAKF